MDHHPSCAQLRNKSQRRDDEDDYMGTSEVEEERLEGWKVKALLSVFHYNRSHPLLIVNVVVLGHSLYPSEAEEPNCSYTRIQRRGPVFP